MRKHEAWRMALLAASALPSYGQDTRQEFRPEVDTYINQGERTRIVFQNQLQQGVNTGFSRGVFFGGIELALRPVFRRELRHQPDVFRNRYLTFRAGYQYSTAVGNGPARENRGILEAIGRYPLPGGFVLRDRNRADLRFVNGQSFSARYRNRLWLEHDVRWKRIAFTPYAFDEIFYDTRYDAWTTNRLGAGVQFPAKAHLVVEPYAMRQESSRSTPRYTNALGLKFSLYF